MGWLTAGLKGRKYDSIQMLQILNLLGKETALWAYIWILFTSPVTFWESMSKCIKQLLACYKIIISIIVASGCNYVFIAEAFHVWKLELILFRRQGLWAKLWPPSSWIIALSWRKGCVTQRRWAMLCRATQDGCVIVESSDKTWSTGGGNGKSLQHSCHDLVTVFRHNLATEQQ